MTFLTYAECEHRPPCLLADGDSSPCGARAEMPGCESREGFYVSVEDNGHRGLLLGPYSTKAAAEGQVDRGRKLACQVNDRAEFYAYGVTRVEMKPGRELPQGKLNSVELVTS
jgi:hypothetical protein